MAAAKKCDRCGNYYDDNRRKRIMGFSVIGIKIITQGPYKNMDLCDICVDELYDFLKIKEDEKND